MKFEPGQLSSTLMRAWSEEIFFEHEICTAAIPVINFEDFAVIRGHSSATQTSPRCFASDRRLKGTDRSSKIHDASSLRVKVSGSSQARVYSAVLRQGLPLWYALSLYAWKELTNIFIMGF